MGVQEQRPRRYQEGVPGEPSSPGVGTQGQAVPGHILPCMGWARGPDHLMSWLSQFTVALSQSHWGVPISPVSCFISSGS